MEHQAGALSSWPSCNRAVTSQARLKILFLHVFFSMSGLERPGSQKVSLRRGKRALLRLAVTVVCLLMEAPVFWPGAWHLTESLRARRLSDN